MTAVYCVNITTYAVTRQSSSLAITFKLTGNR